MQVRVSLYSLCNAQPVTACCDYSCGPQLGPQCDAFARTSRAAEVEGFSSYNREYRIGFHSRTAASLPDTSSCHHQNLDLICSGEAVRLTLQEPRFVNLPAPVPGGPGWRPILMLRNEISPPKSLGEATMSTRNGGKSGSWGFTTRQVACDSASLRDQSQFAACICA
ncbi:hypothetical protein EK21DRAFT_85117 [Setomelanomma holmii]|uniref:Uncharacterized protein n=1 Tax=Setomelanomma holmii TaxID=210430 RepID=A0A9P4HKT9_9PLEO|nr:hypothetical protein EK21DRAFT_85117 [Setomelanomma holmii]